MEDLLLDFEEDLLEEEEEYLCSCLRLISGDLDLLDPLLLLLLAGAAMLDPPE